MELGSPRHGNATSRWPAIPIDEFIAAL